MARKGKGGPFFTLINHHVIAAENAFNHGDYPNCISHIQSLAELLKVKLPHPPFINFNAILINGGQASNEQRGWILQNRHIIDAAVRRWMDSHSKGGVGLWKNDPDMDDDGEDSE